MLKKIFFSLVICALFVSCGNKALKDDYGCFMNYDEAISYSEKSGKPLLVFFTEEDKDDVNRNIVSTVLNNPAFKTEIASKYAVLHLDFSKAFFQKTVAPENATQTEQEEANTYTIVMQNNYTLSVLFNISERPGVFLCTPEGYVVNRIDNLENIKTLDDFKDAVEQNNEKLEQLNKLVKQTTKGSNISRVEAIDNILLLTASEYRSFLLPLFNYGIELDPENKSGLCGRFVLAKAGTEAMAYYSQGDLDSAVQSYLTAADNLYVKAEEKQECLYTAAYLVAYSGSEDYETILSLFQTAYEIAPNSTRAESIQKAIDYFNNKIAE